jgi:hypothetical protein
LLTAKKVLKELSAKFFPICVTLASFPSATTSAYKQSMPGKLFSKRDEDYEEDLLEPPRKRRKPEPTPVATLNSVAGGGNSTRVVGSNSLPSLTTVALKQFIKEFLDQTSREKFDVTKSALQMLPEHLMLRVWSHLVDAWPERMNHDFIKDVIAFSLSYGSI